MEQCGKVTLKKIKRSIEPTILKVQNTYISSFPSIERRDFLLFCDLLVYEQRFNLFVVLNNDEYVGFISYWLFPDFIYIEHFAIDSNKRSAGIGVLAIKSFLALMNRPVILEVENVVDELTARRVRFYERIGFFFHSWAYKQPSYRKRDSWCDMRLMSYRMKDMENKFESIRDTLYRNVYQK
ncbi:MAG: GNAT family N-acetyltransferase [Massilibacteroides sp.]|nr:GNAT family N-acetyltransferase [Massilibacteroides sp.]MDD3062670.1 GNAT family N-acetyltransferase [Massilibacteroides sp.]MDD4114726.1 GNAT family N-acetyltransferase [Massilibacteroides sp.]MDD4660163.1 GNAT family N-acetyltransferase [Massilibacteroides sp.]